MGQREQIEILKAEKASLNSLVKKKDETMQKYNRLDTEKAKRIKSLGTVLKSLQSENEKQKEQILTMEAVQKSFDEQLKQKDAENKELKQKLQAFETMQSVKTKHYSEWSADTLLHWIISLNNGKFKKYEKKLKTTFAEQGVDGTTIEWMDKSDWMDLGIVNMMDRKTLHQHVQDLKNKNPKMGADVDMEDQKEGNNEGGATKYV